MKVPFASQVRAFIRSAQAYHKAGMKPVDEGLARSRAKVCETCRMNRAAVGCGKCNRIAEWIIPTTKDLSKEFMLKSCSVCGCYLKIKVWMPDDVIDSDDRNLDFPVNCWIKKQKTKENA